MALGRNRVALQVAWERYHGARLRIAHGGASSYDPRTVDHVQREMVDALAPLIGKFARRLAMKGVSVDELTAVGKTAVVQALETYATGHGANVQTFLHNAIRGRMLNYLRHAAAENLHEPDAMKWARRKVYKAEREIEAEGGEPTPQAVFERTSIPLRRVLEICWTRDHFRPTARFGPDVLHGEVDPERHPACGVEWQANTDLRMDMESALRYLSPIQRDVIRRRYTEQETQEEVGEALGVTRQRIQQIEKGALLRLRDLMD